MLFLVVAPVYPPEVSGVSQVAFQLATRLARAGHEVHVATRSEAGAPASERREGVQVHRFGVRGSLMTRITGSVESYLAFIESRKWDAVSVHCAQIWSTDLLMSTPSVDPSRIVFTLHGITCIHDPQQSEYTDAVALFARRVSAVVGLSDQFEEAEFCKRYDLPPPVVVPNGVDLAEWVAPRLGMRDRFGVGAAPWIVNVSNHSMQKGHDAFYRVFRATRRRIPDIRADLIGRPVRAQRHGLHRLPIYGGCWYRCRLSTVTEPAVSLKRTLTRTETISSVQEADLTVLTSNWEASPLVILESMAAATPWVSFDVGCVRGHVGGHAVKTEAEMVDAVSHLLENTEEARRLGAAGRDAMQLRDWDSISASYAQLMERARDSSHG